MTLAFVFVNCINDEQAESVEKLLKDVQGVLEANLTTGIYDLILKVQADDEHQLEEVIKRIKAISGVTSTMTSISRSGCSMTLKNKRREVTSLYSEI